MSAAADDHACDLCGLDVGNKPFYLKASGRTLKFCCDGCLGIYKMLHEGELDTDSSSPPGAPINDKKPARTG